MLAIATKGFLLSVSLCLDIGIVNAALINTGMRNGLRPALLMGLGSCFGDLFYAVLSVLGMALLFSFTPVRWVMWLGGGSVLIWLSWKMARSAWLEWRHPHATLPGAHHQHKVRSGWAEFWRGLLMALASPSSLLWFAAVGGSVIAQSTDGSALSAGVFLTGFFLGGAAWSSFLALLASHGQKLVGHQLLLYCNAASAALFAWLAFGVIVHGYQTLL
ncbi:LysE family transporter [uncultured Aquitalea sp.]|uniref:LysE family translocator n=1 Tax=uncultured Aquitalea sp. TaxID=540272 RepID=UPI0025FA5000|nr:LysE family transporter [uncultured Aquitalea sp.]